MKKEMICPECGGTEKQHKQGFNRSGTQRCKCMLCGRKYTIDPKGHEYSEETKKLALKMYYSGVSGRGVGKVLGMSKANVYNWIKKNGADSGGRLPYIGTG
jgi:transposase-like protein